MQNNNKVLNKGLNLITSLKKFSKKPIPVYDKSLLIVKEYLPFKFKLYNGQKFSEISITKDKIGHKFGEFVITKKRHKYVKKKKKKKK